MKGRGGVASERVRRPAARVGDQEAGADQLGIASAPMVIPARKSDTKPRKETLRLSTETPPLNVETEETIWPRVYPGIDGLSRLIAHG